MSKATPTSYRVIILHALLWGAFILLYFSTFVDLYQSRWENIDYTHAYIVLPVALFLAWLRRAEVKAVLGIAVSAADTARGLALIVLAALMFLLGTRMGFLTITTLSLVPMIFGIIFYRYNGRLARVLMFPILYLLLLVPPPLGILDAITLPMRHITSAAAAAILGTFLPVHREGMMIYIQDTQIFVGAPCSGFRSLVTMFALALVYVHVIRMEGARRLVLLASVVPLAMFGNMVRVVVLSLITCFFGKEAGEGFFHNFSGFVIFTIMMSGLLLVAKLIDVEAPDDA